VISGFRHPQGSSGPRRMRLGLLDHLPFKTEPIGCPETWVWSNHSTLRNVPNDCSFQEK